MGDNLPVLYTGGPPDVVEESRFTEVSPVATGRECWWRLGPNIRHRTRTAADRGVADVQPTGGGRCVIVMDSGTVVAVASAGVCWRYDTVVDGGRVACRADTTTRQRVVTVDVLMDYPPVLPQKTDWQQITRAGDHNHPGDDMHNWRYDDPW